MNKWICFLCWLNKCALKQLRFSGLAPTLLSCSRAFLSFRHISKEEQLMVSPMQAPYRCVNEGATAAQREISPSTISFIPFWNIRNFFSLPASQTAVLLSQILVNLLTVAPSMALTATHILRWHFRGSPFFLMMNCYNFFSISCKISSLLYYFRNQDIELASMITLHCRWLCSVWLFPVSWNYFHYEPLIIYGDIHGTFLGHAM